MTVIPLRSAGLVDCVDPAISDVELAALTHRFAARASDYDRDARFPHENFADLREAGLIAAVIDRRYGGAGVTLAQARRVIAAVAAGEPATALVLTMTYLQHHTIGSADCRWPEAVRERVLRSSVDDGALLNALRVEPELGSPSRGGLPGTTARRTIDGWRLSGHKTYATGIEALGWLVVWARTDEASPRVGTFIVPRSAPGISVVPTWDHLGLRASGSHDVIFDDVALPAGYAVDIRSPEEWTPAPGSATARELGSQNAWMVVLLGALYDAIAGAAAGWVKRFLNDRVPGGLGKPLATVPRLQEIVGQIEALLWTNRTLLDQFTSRVDGGDVPSLTESGLLKRQVTTNAIDAVELALTITGNHGLTRRNPLERHHRDVLCSRIHTPQNDAILVTAGKQALEAVGASR